MLQLDNTTPYAAERAVLLDVDGSEIWVVVVKATFEIKNGEAVVAEQQEPVCMTDEFNGEPGISSIKYESELIFKKPGTDVVINGHAWAPKGKPATQTDISVSVANRRQVIRVFGDRLWAESMGGGLSKTAPQAFESVPLLYERAFGGIDATNDDPRKHGAELRNPVGSGFAMSVDALRNKPLPNLEDPSDLISTWKHRPNPMGLGFIGKHWEPRRRYTGTCDQEYIENRLPLYPLDFDFRFFLAATPYWTFSPHLKGGEPVQLKNLTPEGLLAFNLPRKAIGFRTLLDGKWIDHVGCLGTVIIEPDIPRLSMTWQTWLSCHRKTFDLEKTHIYEKRVV